LFVVKRFRKILDAYMERVVRDHCAGLPKIPANVLTARLKPLEAAGVVRGAGFDPAFRGESSGGVLSYY
jgi:hypothetical protein